MPKRDAPMWAPNIGSKISSNFLGKPLLTKDGRINPNIVPNPSPNFNRQFFELVQKSDDENEKK